MSMPPNAERNQRCRGAAMLLVLIAVAMCTIMALSFLAAQQPTAVVASNIDRKTQARAIAESALKMAIDYVNEDANWRSDKASGVWITDASLDGGTFTLTGMDEGDGDLADDSNEPVLLTVVASYQGVTHRVSARVTPGEEAASTNRLMFVVGNGSSPASQDQAKQSLFESWGYVVSFLDDSASQSSYDAMAAVNDVVYISESCNSGSVGTKLRSTTLGVVCDEGYLADDFGLTASNVSSSGTHWGIEITDNSHPVTSGFSVGDVYLHDSAMSLRYVTSSIASGVTVLGERGGWYTGTTLMAAEVGAVLHYGAAAGRRVLFPVIDGYDVDQLNADGETLFRQMLSWAADGAAATTPSGETPTLLALYEFNQVMVEPTLAGRWKLDEPAGGTAAIASDDRIEMKSDSYIDSYNSTLGDYGGANKGSEAYVATNSTNGSRIKGGTINGDAYAGPGGNPNSVINSTVTGTESVLSSGIAMPSYSAPSGSFTNLGDYTYDDDNATWSSNLKFSDLEIKDGSQISVSGDVVIHVTKKFLISDESSITLNSGASLTVYVKEDVEVKNESRVGDSEDAPRTRFVLYSPGKKFLVDDESQFSGLIESESEVEIKNKSRVYGGIVADNDITLDDESSFHMDTATPAIGPGATPVPAVDGSPLSNDGAVSGGPQRGVTGQLGTAYEFDGSDDYIEIPHDDSYLMQGGTFSVWFKTDTTSRSRQGLFSKDSSSYDTGGHFSVFLRNNYVEVRMQSTTTSYYARSSSGSIAAGQWYHIMFAWGEEGMVLYLNGVEVDTDPYTGGLGTTSGGVGNYEPIVLGSNAWGSDDLVATPLRDYFDGTLDDFRVFNERLSESQALEIFNGAEEPTPFTSEAIVEDTSGYEDPLTLVVEDTSAVTWASGGVTFDGDTLAVSLSEAGKVYDAINAAGEFSVEMILQRAAPGSTASPSRIIAMSEGSGDSNFVFGQDGGSYEARVRDSATSGSGVLSPEFISSTSLGSSGDTHVVLSYKDGDVSVYLDGVLDETNTAGGLLNNWEADHFLVLGGEYGGSSYWRGTLKRVAIYDRGFNSSQAQNVYNGNPPGDGASASGVGSVQWDELD